MKNLIISICCIFLFQNTNAQDLPKSWGNFVVSTEVDFNGLALKFDWLRENMSIKVGDDEISFTIGGDDISVEYKADMSNNTFKLQQVILGQEYIDEKIEKVQREKGVPINGEKITAIKNLVHDFVDLVTTTYKINKDYGAGFKDESFSNGIGIELYGKGNAYAGEFKNAERNGRGNYIIKGEQILTGVFENGVQNGHFQIRDIYGMQASGNYINGKQDGLWTYKYADGKKEEFFYKNGKVAEQLISQLPVKKSMDCLIIEEIKNGQTQKATKPFAFWLSKPTKGYRFDVKNGGFGWTGYECDLVDIKKESGKRIETYKHLFKKSNGSSNPTLTFFDKRQMKNGIEYNIILHLISEEFEKKLYCLFDDASVKMAAEKKRQLKEKQQQKEAAMYNSVATHAKKIITDAPNQFKNVLVQGSFMPKYKEKLPYFKKSGYVEDEPSTSRGGYIRIQFTKNTFETYIGDEVPKLVAALDKALAPKYKKCLNKECGEYAIPSMSIITASRSMKGNNKVYIWKQKSDEKQATGKYGTVVLFYDYKKQSIRLSFHALY